MCKRPSTQWWRQELKSLPRRKFSAERPQRRKPKLRKQRPLIHMTDPIRFYRVQDAFGEFSNFSPHSVRLKDRVWPTTEHYFQAQKFPNTEHQEEIRCAASPMIAARLGRARSRP